MVEEVRKGWQRFWALSWWWKGPTLGVTAFIVLIVGIVVASGGGDNDTEGRERATTVTPTSIPGVTPDSTPNLTPDSTPSLTPDSTPSLTPDSTPSLTPDSTPSTEPTQPSALTPAPTTPQAPEPTPLPQADCDPSYPDFCIEPPPPILGCGEIVFGNFTVLPPDPHGFDEDKDGTGCE